MFPLPMSRADHSARDIFIPSPIKILFTMQSHFSIDIFRQKEYDSLGT